MKRMVKLLWLVPCLYFLTAANVSNIKKIPGDGIVVQARDGSQVLIRANGVPLSIQSTNYTVTTTDQVEDLFVTTGSSNRTITLPTVKSSFGRRIRVIKQDTGSGSVLMAVTDGSLIGIVPKVSSQNGTMELLCDGSNWYLKSIHDEGSFTVTFGGTSAGASMTWYYARTSNNVVVYQQGNSSGANNDFYGHFTKNGSAGVVTLSTFPASITPTGNAVWISKSVVSYNDSGTAVSFVPADCQVDSSGVFTLYRDVGGDSFGSATQSTLVATNITYVLK